MVEEKDQQEQFTYANQLANVNVYFCLEVAQELKYIMLLKHSTFICIIFLRLIRTF